MDVLDSLSDIFDDPLLNEFTEKLLNDIDLNELNGVSNDTIKLLDRDVIDIPEVDNKIDSDAEQDWEHSNSTTLEALLKSQNPSSCVPPAPDLCSDLTGVTSSLVPVSTRENTQIDLASNHRRSSLPVLKPDPGTPLLLKDGVTGVKPRLIRDYLEKCDTDDSLQKQPRRFLIGYANQPYHLGSKAPPYEYSANVHPTNGWHSDHLDLNFDDGTAALHDKSKGDKNTRRAPHNAIEKRYRASINGRIDELRKILIPYPTSDAKMNKSAVLRQAIERIKELEAMNERLQAEVMTLRSMHSSCGRLHNSSPESGIVSFEPSPSSSTNISSLDFGGFTSPPLSSDTSCGSSCHNGVSIPSRTLSNDHSMTFLDALDAKRNTWSMEEKPPHLLNTCDLRALGNTQCPEISFDDGVDLVTSAEAHQLFVAPPSYDLAGFPSAGNQDAPPYRRLSPDQIPYSMSSMPSIASRTNDSHDSPTLLVNGYHGKRPLYPAQSGPIKIRRQTLINTAANISNETECRPSDLIIHSQFNSKPSDSSSTPPNPNTLSVVRQLLCSNSSPTTSALSSQVVESTVHYVHGSASGFNGVAARTTLCVAALCLITLDPSMLTGNGRANTGAGGPTSPSSRRLLSSWSELLVPSNTPWIVWLVYLLQWVAATFLCFWACQKRDLSAVFDVVGRSPPKHRLESTEVTKSWNEATIAATEGAWITAEKKLRLCLSVLGCPLPEPTRVTKHYLRSQCWRTIRWLKVFTGSLSLGFFRYPRLVWAVWFTGKRTVDPFQFHVRESYHTPAEVRLRLLEVHLLAPDHSIDHQMQRLLVPLEWAELILLCARDFVESSIGMLKGGHKRKDPLLLQTESLAKSGFMLSIALNRDCGLPHLITRFLLRWISRTLKLLPSSNPGPFTQWAINPITRSLLVNSSSTQLTCPSWFSSFYGTTEGALRAVLQQRIMDYCLRALIFEPTKNLSKLEPYIDSLLQLCDPQSSLSGGFAHKPAVPVSQNADMKAHWWAQFIRAAWFHRTHNPSVPTKISESNMTSMSPNLESPPQDVLNCPQTGCLAEAAWLAYWSLQRAQHVGTSSPETLAGAQRAAKLLRTSLLQIKENLGRGSLVSEDSECMDSLSFWMLACELLIVDWQLSFLSAALSPSRSNLTDQAIAQSATFKRALSAFNTSLSVMLKSSSLLPATTPDWITKKLSYSEAISRLVFGANPVHSRLVLMHACRNSSSTTSMDVRSRTLSSVSSTLEPKQSQDSSNSNFSKTAVDGDTTVPSPSTPISGLLDFDSVILKDTLPCIRPSRCNLITQSPGQ